MTQVGPNHVSRVGPISVDKLKKLGRTIRTWFDKICNYHVAKVSNGPTEALNDLVKRIKRIGFGFRNFENYRIRALLYGSSPNEWCARP